MMPGGGAAASTFAGSVSSVQHHLRTVQQSIAQLQGSSAGSNPGPAVEKYYRPLHFLVAY